MAKAQSFGWRELLAGPLQTKGPVGFPGVTPTSPVEDEAEFGPAQ